MEYSFTKVIQSILEKKFGQASKAVFDNSPLLQYLNIKTRSANSGSKARSAFGNHYALYVLLEDYLKKGFQARKDYAKYEGAKFVDLFKRQRELPFGRKLQNHALNHRLNEEFKKYFPTCDYIPILRNGETNRYWINENLLKVKTKEGDVNIAESVLAIITTYVEAKKQAFEKFMEDCKEIQELPSGDLTKAEQFIRKLIAPMVDARVFEIVSFAILKAHYGSQVVYFGPTLDEVHPEMLILFKTGRTNANDGGIDFVMRPIGRFFQVTEAIDARKYFLDIDKIERFPLTFVIKSSEPPPVILSKVREQASRMYGVESVVDRYMTCIEEVINIPTLMKRFDEVGRLGKLGDVVKEIVLQSRVEFNYEEDASEDEDTGIE